MTTTTMQQHPPPTMPHLQHLHPITELLPHLLQTMELLQYLQHQRQPTEHLQPPPTTPQLPTLTEPPSRHLCMLLLLPSTAPPNRNTQLLRTLTAHLRTLMVHLKMLTAPRLIRSTEHLPHLPMRLLPTPPRPTRLLAPPWQT